MSERTIHIFAKSAIGMTRADGTPASADVIGQALNGDAFSWEMPQDVALTFPTGTVAITFDDADGVLSDDPVANETMIDQRLTRPVTINGVTYTPSGTAIRWQEPPPVYVENEYEVTLFDAAGAAYRMVGVSITQGYTTTVVGVMFDGPAPPPGATLYYRQGASTYDQDGQTVAIPMVPCFLAGTRIETPAGPRRIETLQVGDEVLTLDRGARPIRWIGRSRVPGLGALAPIRIAAGALGNARDLYVSPNHRIFLSAPVAELYFGSHEVLVAAKFLVDGRAIRAVPMAMADYLHLMLDEHEMIFAEGLAAETLFAGPMALGTFDAAALAELRAIFPDLEPGRQRLCRPDLNRAEARLMLSTPPVSAGWTRMNIARLSSSAN